MFGLIQARGTRLRRMDFSLTLTPCMTVSICRPTCPYRRMTAPVLTFPECWYRAFGSIRLQDPRSIWLRLVAGQSSIAIPVQAGLISLFPKAGMPYRAQEVAPLKPVRSETIIRS